MISNFTDGYNGYGSDYVALVDNVEYVLANNDNRRPLHKSDGLTNIAPTGTLFTPAQIAGLQHGKQTVVVHHITQATAGSVPLSPAQRVALINDPTVSSAHRALLMQGMGSVPVNSLSYTSAQRTAMLNDPTISAAEKAQLMNESGLSFDSSLSSAQRAAMLNDPTVSEAEKAQLRSSSGMTLAEKERAQALRSTFSERGGSFVNRTQFPQPGQFVPSSAPSDWRGAPVNEAEMIQRGSEGRTLNEAEILQREAEARNGDWRGVPVNEAEALRRASDNRYLQTPYSSSQLGGQPMNKAMFFDVGAQTVLGNAAVSFSQNGANNSLISRLSNTTFNLPTAGKYEVSYQVSGSAPSQLQIAINGVGLVETVINSLAGSNQLSGFAAITTDVANAILSIINPSANNQTLTVQQGNEAHSVSLSVRAV